MQSWATMTRDERLELWYRVEEQLRSDMRSLEVDLNKQFATMGVPFMVHAEFRLIPASNEEDPRLP